MQVFTITTTGFEKHCILTGPMGSIVSVEFTNRKDAALFAQTKADGRRATLRLVNERGGYEGSRPIPPPPGMEPREEKPHLMAEWAGMGMPTSSAPRSTRAPVPRMRS